MRYAVFTLAALLGLAPPLAAADFDVSNVGSSAYSVNGQNNPTLTLYRGVTYTFAVNAPGHPFWIKTAAILGTVNAFNTGVTGNGTQNGTVTFSVPQSAPGTLFYICQFHSPMTGTLLIADPTAVETATWDGIKGLFR